MHLKNLPHILCTVSFDSSIFFNIQCKNWKISHLTTLPLFRVYIEKAYINTYKYKFIRQCEVLLSKAYSRNEITTQTATILILVFSLLNRGRY